MLNRAETQTSQAKKSNRDTEGEFKLTGSMFDGLISDLHLPEHEILKIKYGIKGWPIYNDFLQLQFIRSIISRDNNFGIAEQVAHVPFSQLSDYEFCNPDHIARLMKPALSFTFDHIPIKMKDWPRDGKGKPILTREALGLDSGPSIPQPNYLILSIPDREPPRVDLVYFMACPVFHSKNARKKPIKLYYDTQKLYSRKTGGQWIGQKGYVYNPFWYKFRTDNEQGKRFAILRQDLWTLIELLDLLRQMPDGNRTGRDYQIADLCKQGNLTGVQIGKQFGISRSRVCQIARDQGINLKRPIDKEAIRQMSSNGYSQRAIAKETGYSKTTIANTLNPG